jgi:hypothetical protein
VVYGVVESRCGQLSPDVVDNGACVPSHHADAETLRLRCDCLSVRV